MRPNATSWPGSGAPLAYAASTAYTSSPLKLEPSRAATTLACASADHQNISSCPAPGGFVQKRASSQSPYLFAASGYQDGNPVLALTGPTAASLASAAGATAAVAAIAPST